MLPIIFSNSNLTIYSYPLLMGLAWGIGYRIFRHVAATYTTIPEKRLGLFTLGLFLSSWFGAKLLFMAVGKNTPDSLIESRFWLGGGFVFYGGMLGAILFLLVTVHIIKRIPKDIYPTLIPALAIGHGIGRIGCFLAGCCYGIVCHSDVCALFSFKSRIAVQLIEAGLLLNIGAMTLKYYAKIQKNLLVPIYIIVYATIRFILEFMRGDDNRGIYDGLSTSQWISIGLVLLVTVYLFVNYFTSRRKQA